MSSARRTLSVVLLLLLAGCESRTADRQRLEAPESLSPAVARFRHWAGSEDTAGFAPRLQRALQGRAVLQGRDAYKSTHTSGAHGRVFEDSTAVALELVDVPWDSAMAVASSLTERFLDELAPGGEPLVLRAPEPLPLGGARWRWLTATRAGELRLRGEPRPGWPRNALWQVTLALTDRPATAYDRGIRPREVREASRVARWFDSLMRRGEREPSTLVRWAVAAGATRTGMDGHSTAVEGGRFADERTLRVGLELAMDLEGIAPDSIARAVAPWAEAGLREALGAHGELTRTAEGRWSFLGRGRAGTLSLESHRDSGGRDWLQLSLVDGPAARR